MTLVAFLMRESRWELIADVLDESFLIRNNHYGEPRSFSFEYVSDYIETLEYRKRRLNSNRISIRADMLNERHSKLKLAEICPMEEFISADYFLFVRAEFDWKPWSALYLFEYLPDFVVAAIRAKFANQILKPLAIESIERLREVLRDRATKVHAFYRSGFWHSRMDGIDYSTIGTK